MLFGDEMVRKIRLQYGERFQTITVMLIAFAVTSLQFLRFLHVNLDDKYMLYRYALNCALGNGFSFNPGQPVEGFTSFLYVVVMAGIFKAVNLFGSSVSDVARMSAIGKVLSLVFTFITEVYLVLAVKRIVRAGMPVVLICLLLVSFNTEFVFHSTNGLETGLFIAVFTAYLYHLSVMSLGTMRHRRHFFATVLFGALTILARSDGMVFIGTITALWGIGLCMSTGWRVHNVARDLVSMALPVMAVTVAYEVFRYRYFGAWLPNTCNTKFPGASGNVIELAADMSRFTPALGRISGVTIGYVFGPVAVVFVLMSLNVVSGILLYRKKNGFWSDEALFNHLFERRTGAFSLARLLAIFAAAFCIFSIYTLFTGGEWMPGSRYVMHFYPFFAVIGAALFCRILSMVIKNDDKNYFISYVAVCISIVLVSTALLNRDRVIVERSRGVYMVGSDAVVESAHTFAAFKGTLDMNTIFVPYIGLSIELKKRLHSGDTVALYESGAIPLLLGNTVTSIDLSGLNDAYIARQNSDEGWHSVRFSFLYYPTKRVRGPVDRYLVAVRPVFIILDTFVFFRQPVPDMILDGRYRKVENFPGNNLNFFTVYERTATTDSP